MSTKEWREKNINKLRGYRRKWYSSNKDKAKSAVRKRKQELKNWLDSYKDTLKCELCNEDEPCCLDFHHKDPTKKDRSLSSVISWGWSIKRILDEINKCNILCSNCHRKLHADKIDIKL